MPNCHQCNAVLAGAGRRGACRTCFKPDARFCDTCGVWELGPADDSDIYLRDPVPVEAPTARISARRLSRSTPSDELTTVAPSDLLNLMARRCPLINAQCQDRELLHGVEWETYVRNTLARFDELYPECPFDTRSMHVLIIGYLCTKQTVERSAELGADDTADVRHRQIHRFDIRQLAEKHHHQHFRGLIHPDIWDEAPVALGSDDLEWYLKGKRHITLSAKKFLELGDDDVARARTIFEISVLLYHAIHCVRTRAEIEAHPSNTTVTFRPAEALGYLSTHHYAALFGDVDTPGDFTDETKDRLKKLYAAIGSAGLPQHPRYPDADVAASTLLTQVEKDYLQYLPTLDEADPAQRTECETQVRTRVVETLARVMGGGVATDGVRADARSMVDDAVRLMRRHFIIESTWNHAGQRRIENGLRSAGNGYEFKSYFGAKTQGIGFNAAFPSCNFRPIDEFQGLEQAYKEDTDGNNRRPDHYLDWRNDKDHWIYDCFEIEKHRRPFFASLTFAPNLPEPNTTYGVHLGIFHQDRVFHRSVFTLTDNGSPRRSMLLLLDELLHPRNCKNGKAPQSEAARLGTIGLTYDRVRALRAGLVTGGTQIGRQLWEWQLKRGRPPKPDPANVEAHVFGPVTMEDDLHTFVLGHHYQDDLGMCYTGVEESAFKIDLYRFRPGIGILTYDISPTSHRYPEQPRFKNDPACQAVVALQPAFGNLLPPELHPDNARA